MASLLNTALGDTFFFFFFTIYQIFLASCSFHHLIIVVMFSRSGKRAITDRMFPGIVLISFWFLDSTCGMNMLHAWVHEP